MKSVVKSRLQAGKLQPPSPPTAAELRRSGLASPACAEPAAGRPPGEGEVKDAPRRYWDRPQPSAACGHSGEPKFIDSERRTG